MEQPPLAPAAVGSADRQSVNAAFFAPIPPPSFPLILSKSELRRAARRGERLPQLPPNIPPAGWDTDDFPSEYSGDALRQWLERLTLPVGGVLPVLSLTSLHNEAKKKIASRYVRQTWQMVETLKAMGTIHVPNRQELRDYMPQEACVVLTQLKESLFSSVSREELDGGNTHKMHPPASGEAVAAVENGTDRVGKLDRPRRRRVPRAEANVSVRDHLERHPDATVAEIREATGVSTGAISQCPAWRANMESKRSFSDKASKARREVPLTPEMVASMPVNNDPSDIAALRDAAWQELIDRAEPEERARLHEMKTHDRDELIEQVMEQRKNRGEF
jgi:hypothetical protein